MTQTTTIEFGRSRRPATAEARRSAEDRRGRHLRLRLRHVAATGAVVALGVLAPGTGGASASSTGQPVPGPGDLTTEEPCDFELGPCPGQPVDPCEGDAPPEHCDPVDPCEGDAPPEHCDSSTSIVPQSEVDAPVRATPNFTG